MTTQTTLTFTLEEFLTKFEQRIDQKFAEVNQKMDKQFAEVNQKMDQQFAEVNQKLTEVNKQFAEVNQTLNDVKIGQADLSAKVDGIDKRLSNQEFFNRSFFLAVIASLLGVAAKFFGVLPPDK